MGGVNGWWFAACHPELVERLAIIDVDPKVFTFDEVVSGWMAALGAYAQSQYADPEEAVTGYLAEYTGPHQQELRTFVPDNLKEDSDGRWIWWFGARGLVSWMEHASANVRRIGPRCGSSPARRLLSVPVRIRSLTCPPWSARCGRYRRPGRLRSPAPVTTSISSSVTRSWRNCGHSSSV
jgi:hypothetical protein